MSDHNEEHPKSGEQECSEEHPRDTKDAVRYVTRKIREGLTGFVGSKDTPEMIRQEGERWRQPVEEAAHSASVTDPRASMGCRVPSEKTPCGICRERGENANHDVFPDPSEEALRATQGTKHEDKSGRKVLKWQARQIEAKGIVDICPACFPEGKPKDVPGQKVLGPGGVLHLRNGCEEVRQITEEPLSEE